MTLVTVSDLSLRVAGWTFWLTVKLPKSALLLVVPVSLEVLAAP